MYTYNQQQRDHLELAVMWCGDGGVDDGCVVVCCSRLCGVVALPEGGGGLGILLCSPCVACGFALCVRRILNV